MRALRSLGINYEHFGPLLVPIILEKLPNTIKLQISRKLGKKNWNIKQFLSAIYQEITARENFKQNSFDSKEESKNFTTSSFHAQARRPDTLRKTVKIKCFRCKAEENHHTAICYPKNYSLHTNATTTDSDQNNSSITPPANEQTATCLVKSDTTIVCYRLPAHVSSINPKISFVLLMFC